MNIKVVYEQLDPPVMIGCDDYQWVLSVQNYKDSKQNKVVWTSYSYHSTLTLLLDNLSEKYFRKLAKAHGGWKAIEDSVYKTYKLITKVTKDMSK